MEKTDLPDITLQTDPTLGEGVFVAQGAQVMGDVRLGNQASVWYNAVVRGDVNHIAIGERSNIQDGCVLHVTNAKPCIIGNDVTVGHHVNLHGCTVEDGCLIGIGAIVLTGAHIGKGAIVGAGAVVRENTVVEPGSLVVGVPAKPKGSAPENTYEENLKWAIKYVKLAALHREKYGTANVCT